jgi:general secretion pathway protein G
LTCVFHTLVFWGISMRTQHSPRAFTLIEVLIVVVIMAVLAGSLIARFSSPTKDAEDSSLKYNLRIIRAQIELYKHDHLSYPGNGGTVFPDQLLQRTTPEGKLDPNGRYGPYLSDGFPVNPFNHSRAVAIVSGNEPPAAATGGPEGWQYNPEGGWFYPNNAEYFKP